jgi:Ca2+:H+ antiporter
MRSDSATVISKYGEGMVFNLLLIFVPLSLILAYLAHAAPVWIFLCSAIAIVPLAEWIRRATDQLAKRIGSAIGGLLNVTFGNVAELVLALFVLTQGNQEVVKAQITGSIIGNSLLGLGLAIVVGSWRREKQTFKRERAGLLSSLLLISVIALLIPALFHYTEKEARAAHPETLDERLSLAVSVVLILVYFGNLVFTMVTHRDVFAFGEEHGKSEWSLWKSIAVLAGGTVLIAWESELLSDALEATAGQLGISKFFLGVTVLAVIGNAAEYFSAAYFAHMGRMGLALTITVGSSIQVALLVAPVLVLASYFTGHPMNLVFANPLELIAIAGAAFAVNAIAHDGETTWFEGVLLLTVYILLGLAFFFVTPFPP